MRALICPTVACKRQPALLPASPARPKGEPYLSMGYVPVVRCARCKRSYELSRVDFNRLPVLGLDELKALAKQYPGLEAVLTQDLEGLGVTKAQAEDLFRAGFRGSEEVTTAPVDPEAN